MKFKKLNVFYILLIISLILFMPASVFAQAARIIVDGQFSDWDDLSPLYIDSADDQSTGDLDFGQLWVANDDQFLFILLQIGEELNLQDDNQISMYLDTDLNSDTGLPVQGIGADLTWTFGEREGQFYVAGNPMEIIQSQIYIVTPPTVTSTQFEISLYRPAQPDGQTALFPGDTFRIAFEDGGAGGDYLPDDNDIVSYTFDNTPVPAVPSISLGQNDPAQLRVMTYNVLFDGFFIPDRRPYFERILNAIQPEIIGFEEIYQYSAGEIAAEVESMLPSGPGQQWYGAKQNDNVAISRFPILESFWIEGNGAFLIDLQPAFDSELLFLVAHPPCCDNNEGRQYEIDAMMAFIRDAREPGGVLDLVPNTPIIIVGDMNLVGYAQQLVTLLTGDIINQDEFGLPFDPDWDGSDLADLHPPVTDLPMTFTWFDAGNSFSPGRLDFIVYTDSVLEIGNRFVLFTPAMSADSLAAHGLLPEDTISASDHLPVVADFDLSGEPTQIETGSIRHRRLPFILAQNHPNPWFPNPDSSVWESTGSSQTTIQFSLPQKGQVKLQIFNLAGQIVKTLVSDYLVSGEYRYSWDGKDDSGAIVSGGLYIYQLRSNDFVDQKKMMLLK